MWYVAKTKKNKIKVRVKKKSYKIRKKEVRVLEFLELLTNVLF